jgi:hypothetical protein
MNILGNIIKQIPTKPAFKKHIYFVMMNLVSPLHLNIGGLNILGPINRKLLWKTPIFCMNWIQNTVFGKTGLKFIKYEATTLSVKICKKSHMVDFSFWLMTPLNIYHCFSGPSVCRCLPSRSCCCSSGTDSDVDCISTADYHQDCYCHDGDRQR